ncbi:hypothetical protein R0L47_14600 [Pectobacterium polonicum]|uniref:Uncharacterized protein n=1 Tax=Pectobacterium polonicum TaxID=2485124 RepID=A0AAE9NMA8_9GAMM|nr:hypothetical protein [Pectobacterium polonicum]MDC9820102.1 hypothetical protein [Pectobacterium polonicum]TKY83298.1 hypothetical protein EDI29_04805 [Pectobacterium polonicum]UVO07650.1 hypothetical protein LW347_17640 [Pectobacterium polonicum]GKW25129.1 hypothetical protein PEC311524_27230 [Pectobacterium carotovorum subsp. carotovorum]
MLEAGTYSSEDGKHTLVITDPDFAGATFTGTFTAKDTPVGEYTYQGESFSGSWLYTAGRATINLGVACTYRNNIGGYNYVIRDYWVGTSTDTPQQITLSGSRSYTTISGGQQRFSFEDVVFTRQVD